MCQIIQYACAFYCWLLGVFLLTCSYQEWVWGSCVRGESSYMCTHIQTHTHTRYLCFSSEEHTLSSGVWQLRHYCLPHISRAVYPLHNTGCQVAPGQLSHCTISYKEFSISGQSILFLVFGLNIHIFQYSFWFRTFHSLSLSSSYFLLLIMFIYYKSDTVLCDLFSIRDLTCIGVFSEIFQILAREL